MHLSREENIRLRKQQKGYKDRHTRKIEKFSDGFNAIFFFFLKCYRKNILTFGGSSVDVVFDINSHSCREAFRRFDDGQFKYKQIITRHPNIVKAVIMAKKSWGLNLDSWTDGIAECSFRRQEILHIFEEHKIKLPEQFEIEFYNLLYKKRVKYFERNENWSKIKQINHNTS